MIHNPYIEAQPRRIDYDLIADTGDVEMYRRAWNENPSERPVLEDIFPDLQEAAFGEGEDEDDLPAPLMG
jgi:hypothetical protein